VVEQGTHKPLVGGSNPPSATNASPLDDLAAAVLGGAGAVDLPPDARLTLAVSGGPDSIALLHGAAHLLRTDAVSWHVTVAHLDHRVRPESGDDARFVADAAAALRLPVEVRAVDVAARAREHGASIEEAGRDARYEMLADVAGADGWIATGHTADDAAETVLLNLMRGTGTTGLRGIPPRRGRIVRPLLGVRRAWLRDRLDAAGIAYRRDPSNEDPAYLRNRVRNELLPAMESIRPGAVDRILRFATLASDDDELLESLARAELERRMESDGAIDWHDPPAPALARRVLRLAIGPPAPSAERVDALLEAASGSRGGVVIELGAGRTASVRGRRIRVLAEASV
jgi:tRNA(Ile)-lysidine synthase